MAPERHTRLLLLLTLGAACVATRAQQAPPTSGGAAAPVALQSATPAKSAPAGDCKCPPPLDPTLDPNMVAREVKSHLGNVKECYEQYLKLDPSLAGKLVVHWTISKKGTVSEVDTEENTFGSVQIADCVKEVVSRWQFPPPTGGSVEVSFPFVFMSH
jgi:hypothetical protein